VGFAFALLWLWWWTGSRMAQLLVSDREMYVCLLHVCMQVIDLAVLAAAVAQQ
jgi:hypothetical protein